MTTRITTQRRGRTEERYYFNRFRALLAVVAKSFIPYDSIDIEFLTKEQLNKEIFSKN